VVAAPTAESAFRHIEFVPLSPGRALVVVVTESSMVENRVIEVPLGMSASTLVEAGNYLTARLTGRTFSEAMAVITAEIDAQSSELDALTRKVVEAGLATWGAAGDSRDDGVLIVRGHANLLEDVSNLADLERIRSLFTILDTKRSLARLIELAQGGDTVQIFIGSENELFALTGCSMVVAPYSAGSGQQVVGAIGVIGPSRMNYARIIPMVDYTARVVSRLLGGSSKAR
jgi:heat-inducible transcriptional repressor